MINDISIKHQIALMMRFRTSFSSLVKYHHMSIIFMVTRYEEDFKKSIVEMVKAGDGPMN